MYDGMSRTVAQKAALKRQLASNALGALDLEREQREESVAGINAIDRTSAPRSGYLGERDYIIGKNHEGEAARLRSIVQPKSGGYGVQSSYAGTNFANGGARESMAAARRAATAGTSGADEQGPSDNFDYYARQRALEQSQLQNQRLREQAFRESTVDHPGYAKQRGDVAREELIRNAKAEGDAASAKFRAEGPMRADKELEDDWNRRKLERERGYYDPAVEIARIKGITDISEKAADRQRERSAALKEMSNLLKQQSATQQELPTGDREQEPGVFGWMKHQLGYGKPVMKPNPAYDALQQQIESVRGILDRSEPPPMAGGGAPGAGGEGQQVSMEELQGFAQEQGISIDQAMQIARQYGWAVR